MNTRHAQSSEKGAILDRCKINAFKKKVYYKCVRDHPYIMSPPWGEGGPPKGDTSIYPYVVKRVTRGRGVKNCQNGGDIIPYAHQ